VGLPQAAEISLNFESMMSAKPRLKNCLEQFFTSARRGWSMDAPDKKLSGAIFHVSPKGLEHGCSR